MSFTRVVRRLLSFELLIGFHIRSRGDVIIQGSVPPGTVAGWPWHHRLAQQCLLKMSQTLLDNLNKKELTETSCTIEIQAAFILSSLATFFGGLIVLFIFRIALKISRNWKTVKGPRGILVSFLVWDTCVWRLAKLVDHVWWWMYQSLCSEKRKKQKTKNLPCTLTTTLFQILKRQLRSNVLYGLILALEAGGLMWVSGQPRLHG